jgi:signal transduction histidine kinase/CheY-like chemotaxis protein
MTHQFPRGSRRRLPGAYLAAGVLVVLAIWADMLLAARGGPRFVFLCSSLAVAATAWLAGFVPALLAIAATAIATDFFILGPGQWLDAGGVSASAAFALFVAGWIGVSRVVRAARVRAGMEVTWRVEAESVAAQSARLADLAGAFARARSEAAVIEAAVQEPLHSLQADAAMFLVVSDDEAAATVVRAVAYERTAELVGRQVPLDEPGALRNAIRMRAVVTVDSREAGATGDAETELVPPMYAACAIVPLSIGGRVAAIVRIDFKEPHGFDEDDREFLDLLSRFAAQTLERERQYESAQRARDEADGLRERADQEIAQRQKTEQALRASETRYRALATRTTRLHALTAGLSEAVTVDAVARAVVQQGNVVVGATSGSVLLLVGDGSELAVVHAEAYGRVVKDLLHTPVEPGLCEADAVQRRAPIFVASWDDAQEQYWRSATSAADAAYVSSAVLPLLVEGAPTGVLRFDFSVPVNFDSEYKALLVSVAQHCTQALDRARLYEGEQRARAGAEEANRHKDEFLSIVSHELRTPLNAVLGWAAMLQKDTSDASLTARAVQSIHDNASRQARLIDDLLDVSRIVAGRTSLDMQPVDLASLITGVVESFIPVAASGHVDLHVPHLPAATVTGDPRRLEQVFFNLLANALKFTEPGGRIEIDGAVTNGVVEVRVHDSGIGIEPEFLPHVFEPFRQANSTSTRNYGGLGLGLSIAKQLVDAHDGTIRVESEGVGCGAVFLVAFPVAALAPALPGGRAAALPRTVAPAPRLDGVRVLGVDDEPAAREIMGYALSSQGAEVTVAASAAEAFDILKHHDFDVLLADIAMPDEDGCALLRRVRSSANVRMASIPAAAVTAHARDDERREVLAAGFQLHLVKPIEPADLARAVDQLAHGKSAA